MHQQVARAIYGNRTVIVKSLIRQACPIFLTFLIAINWHTNQKPETGNWKLETGNRKLATGNRQPLLLPHIPQRYRAVEDQVFIRRIGIQREISFAQELVALFGARCGEGWLSINFR